MFDVFLEILKGLSGIFFGFVIATLVGWWQLKKGHFWGRVTFTHASLTKDMNLCFDTMLDKRAIDVWIDNSVLRNRIRVKAEKCSNKKPFVCLENAEDNHKIYTGIRNQISAHFSRGIVYKAFQRNVGECIFYFSFCSLNSPSDKSKKLHVLIYTADFMEKLMAYKNLIYKKNPSKKELIDIFVHLCENKAESNYVRIYLPIDDITNNYCTINIVD